MDDAPGGAVPIPRCALRRAHVLLFPAGQVPRRTAGDSSMAIQRGRGRYRRTVIAEYLSARKHRIGAPAHWLRAVLLCVCSTKPVHPCANRQQKRRQAGVVSRCWRLRDAEQATPHQLQPRSALSPWRACPAAVAGSASAAVPAPRPDARSFLPRAGCSAPAGCSLRSWCRR